MISLPAGARIFLACGTTDMRKGFDGLVAQVEHVLGADPYVGALFVFRGDLSRLARLGSSAWHPPRTGHNRRGR